ncbi:major facilitator superfamily domain-containing protein [Xylariomycetidae sp. FL2044]|nr:major facilitator superfamily domain-containing protein [Xylariomycetidae sp. FL2044]
MTTTGRAPDNDQFRDVERDAGLSGRLNSVGHADAEESSHDAETSNTSVNDDVSKPTSPSPADDAAMSAKEPDAAKGPPEAERTPLQLGLIMAALCSALFLAALDVTIITTAIPTIVSEFDSPQGYTWIGAAYLLANSATVPLWGKISDIWGRKPVLLAAVATFWVGSLLCAVSVNSAMLIACRAIQGAGGGGIVVLSNISVGDLVSVRKRGMYYGMFGGVWAIASAIGPVLGGVFTSEVTWRWCFYVNLPISGLGFALLVLFLRLHNPKTPARQGLKAIDWLGSVLVIGGTLMFLLGLEFGGVTYPWDSPTTICLIVFGIVTIGIFVVVEKYYTKYPVIPLRLFTPQSVAIFGVCFAHGFVFISGSYYLPLYFQAVLGANSLMSGVYILPFVLSMSFASIGTGIFIKKTGKYVPAIILGMVIMTLGFGLFIDLGARANWAKIIVFQIIAGFGVGPIFQSPLIALQSNIEGRDIASATSTFAFIRQIATSVSVVIGGVVFQNGMQSQYSRLRAELGPDLANQLSGGSAGASVGLVASLRGDEATVARQAYWNSLQTMFIMYTVFAGVGLLITPFIAQRQLSKDHQEHKTGLHTLRSNTNKKTKKPRNTPAASEGEKHASSSS